MSFLEELEASIYFKAKAMIHFLDHYVISTLIQIDMGLEQLTYERWMLLSAIGDEPGKSMKEYAEILNKDVSTLSNTFKYFVKNELVIKKLSQKKRGAYEIYLTPRGEQAVDIVANIYEQVIGYVQSKFTKDELQAFNHACDKFSEYTFEIGKQFVEDKK